MGKSKKKEKYVPLTGLTGIGEDYNIYIMDPREKIIGYLIGFVAGFLAAQIMFGVVIASIVIGAAVASTPSPCTGGTCRKGAGRRSCCNSGICWTR